MSPAYLNAVLSREHPAARALLAPLGERAALPLGIPQQSAQSAHCERQATIGQITSGSGLPLALPSLAAHFSDLDAKQALLYAPQHGLLKLRQAWQAHAMTPDLPVVTCGMTHGLSITADLFTSPDRPLVVAAPYWDNYDNIATMRTGAAVVTYPFYNAARRFNIEGLSRTLDAIDGPATVLLNFPNNPTGYSPWSGEGEEIIAMLSSRRGPLCVVCDDAYHTLYFDEGMYGKSLFHGLAANADPSRLLVVKVDGATKELVFFGGRVGFLSFSASGAAGQALNEKAAAILRGTISSVSAPAQSAVLAALASPTLVEEQKRVVGVLRERFTALKSALSAKNLRVHPFNSGCFALLPVPAGQDAEALRQRLITERSTGVIAVPSANSLRVAFCSIEAADIPDLVDRLAPLLAQA